MSELTAYISHDEYLKYQFGPSHPFKPVREKYALALLRELGIFEGKARIYEPRPASEEELHLVHSPKIKPRPLVVKAPLRVGDVRAGLAVVVLHQRRLLGAGISMNPKSEH